MLNLKKKHWLSIFGIKKFHQYLYGRKFTLVTDHKPLTTILGPKKGIPVVAASRLQRWAMLWQHILTIYSIGLHMTMEIQLDIHVYHYRRTDLMWKV